MRTFLCAAQGRHGSWEAMCLDLDIAVQGQTLDEVRTKLNEAIHGYIESAMAEDARVRDQLLRRRAPLLTRLSVVLRIFISSLSNNDDNGDYFEANRLPCPA
ncbi:type II toxin-antitoxin system HicB family antitoxin [Maricaulis sp.]|uniref:type II toxin-antitoxin system HicB family antitoxin n=1 Tax=Maricaulis sp. TaxID=1486257 RepID=UPI003A94C733